MNQGRLRLRPPVPPPPPRPPGRAEWLQFAVAQGMALEDAVTLRDEDLQRWFEEDEDDG